MEVGAAGSLALYNYQTTLANYGQGSTSISSTAGSAQNAAVLQALDSAYTGLTSGSTGGLPAADPLSTLAGDGLALGSLVQGIYATSVASGSTASLFPSLANASATAGGLDATGASILFPSSGIKGLEGISSSAINLNASLALASYATYQSGLQSNPLGAAATSAATSSDPTQTASIQAEVQGAQAATFASTMNLLA